MIQRSVLLLFGGACIATSASAQQSKKPDARAIAHQLIASTMIREGQSVLISGSVRDAGLMEDLAIEARKAGAQPMLVISSERLIRRSYDEVPAKYDAQEPKLDLAVAKLFDAQIAIDVGETEGLLAGVPAERLAARAKAGAPVNEAFLERNVHLVNLGNGLYPTATLAKRLGITQARLATGFWRAVAVPPERLQAAGEQLRTAFASGGTVQLTHPNGTSLTFDVTGRTPTISAGALTPGGPAKTGSARSTSASILKSTSRSGPVPSCGHRLEQYQLSLATTCSLEGVTTRTSALRHSWEALRSWSVESRCLKRDDSSKPITPHGAGVSCGFRGGTNTGVWRRERGRDRRARLPHPLAMRPWCVKISRNVWTRVACVLLLLLLVAAGRGAGAQD